ncbi:MAG: hypothetical protein IJR54_04550 [Oscillibacter sp.]|nr:hypothetical protein [Oscillibacter sp.]
MDENNVMEAQETLQEVVPGKKPRKPRRKMTPEEKEEAARKRAERKAQADSMKPAVYVQYEGAEALIDDLIEAATADFRKEKKRAKIIEFKLYVKPEERAAYYVINGTYDGKVEY